MAYGDEGLGVSIGLIRKVQAKALAARQARAVASAAGPLVVGMAPAPIRNASILISTVRRVLQKPPAIPSPAGPVIPQISFDPGTQAPPLPPEIPAPILSSSPAVQSYGGGGGWFGGGGVMTAPQEEMAVSDGGDDTGVMEAGVTGGGGLGNVSPVVLVVGLGALFLLAKKGRR